MRSLLTASEPGRGEVRSKGGGGDQSLSPSLGEDITGVTPDNNLWPARGGKTGGRGVPGGEKGQKMAAVYK